MMFREQVALKDLTTRFPSIFATSEKQTLSEKYLYIPTFKLVEGLEKQGFQIVGAKQQNTRKAETREHGKHVIYLTHSSMRETSLMSVGEEIPMLALTNSHNGLSSFQLDTAFFRLVCSNGLLMPSTSMNSARIIHKIGMEQDVLDAAYRVVQFFPEQVKEIIAMKNLNLSTNEQMLLASSASRLIFEESQIELNRSVGVNIAAKLITPRRRSDSGSDLWSTFNVIQENIIKGGHRVITENEQGQRSRTKMRAVGSIDRDAKLNRELMRLAQEFAALKTAI